MMDKNKAERYVFIIKVEHSEGFVLKGYVIWTSHDTLYIEFGG